MARGAVSLLRADPEHFILYPRSTYEYARVKEREREGGREDRWSPIRMALRKRREELNLCAARSALRSA